MAETFERGLSPQEFADTLPELPPSTIWVEKSQTIIPGFVCRNP
jgi:hypothetical protein